MIEILIFTALLSFYGGYNKGETDNAPPKPSRNDCVEYHDRRNDKVVISNCVYRWYKTLKEQGEEAYEKEINDGESKSNRSK